MRWNDGRSCVGPSTRYAIGSIRSRRGARGFCRYTTRSSPIYTPAFCNRFHMGRTLAEVRRDATGKCKVTTLDADAKAALEEFLTSHPELSAFMTSVYYIAEVGPGGAPPPPSQVQTTPPPSSQVQTTGAGTSELLEAYSKFGRPPFRLKGRLAIGRDPAPGVHICHYAMRGGGRGFGEIVSDMQSIAAIEATSRIHVWHPPHPNSYVVLAGQDY